MGIYTLKCPVKLQKWKNEDNWKALILLQIYVIFGID